MIREKVSSGIEDGANSEQFSAISEQADGLGRGRLFLEIESQTLQFGSLKAFEASEPVGRFSNSLCPRCGRTELNIYFSGNTDEKLGAWCGNCNLKGYFDGNELISMEYSE